jgi:acetyltransferase-like isoleucine patch superfamily enzyme
MSFLWNLLDGGVSMPENQTAGQRLALRVGRWLATRHGHVTLAPDARLHPDARVHPRAGSIRIGRRSVVAAGAIIQGNIEIGDDCSVQAYAILVGYGTREEPSGCIRIGNNVRIAPHAMLIAANHVFSDINRPIREQGMAASPIVVEDDVWIAGRVSITAGVTVGRGSVIAAGAVVTRDVPPWSVVAGVPAKVIRKRGA